MQQNLSFICVKLSYNSKQKHKLTRTLVKKKRKLNKNSNKIPSMFLDKIVTKIFTVFGIKIFKINNKHKKFTA